MKFQSTLVFTACAFTLGVAFAAPTMPRAAGPVQGTPLERLEAVEKRVVELEAELTALKKSKTGEALPTTDAAGQKQVEEQLVSVMSYLAAQAEAAKRLDERLVESRTKGFTFGINPDSREAMLAGFAEFTTTLQTDVPKAKKPAASTAQR
jgi:hypothetical protein